MHPTSDFFPSWSEMKLGRLDPTFIIPENTPVVTIIDRKIPGTTRIRRAGSRGHIDRAPADNAYPYLVRFEDGAKLFFKQRELALAESRDFRAEFADERTDYSSAICFSAPVGLKIFGLQSAVPADRPDSIRGAFIPSADKHWSLFKVPEQIQRIAEPADELYWEFEKFLRIALEGQPSAIEALFSPGADAKTAIGRDLVKSRMAFVSVEIGRAYAAFVLAQFKKIETMHAESGRLDFLRSADLVRVLHAGRITLYTGEVVTEVMEHRTELLDILAGRWDFSRLRERVWGLERELRRTIDISPLPKRPDLDAANALLLRARTAQAKSFLAGPPIA